MNTDITGIGDLAKVKAAAEKYRNAMDKLCTIYLSATGSKGMVGNGLNNSNTTTAGVLASYDSAISSKAKSVVHVVDSLINSINSVNANYNKSVTQQAGSVLSSAAKKMKS